MAEVTVEAPVAGEVERSKDRKVVRVLERRDAIACTRVRVSRQRISVGIHTGRVVGRVDHAELVVLAQEGLLIRPHPALMFWIPFA